MQDEEKMRKLGKVAMTLCVAAGAVSLVVFIPQVRELIIQLGDVVAGKSINREKWSSEIISWEVEILAILSFGILCLLPENRYKPLAKIESLLKSRVVPWMIVVASSAVLIALAFQSNDIWFDETFSLGLARHSVAELISLTARDVHPPLYYVILKAGIALAPNSVALARIISVIPILIILCVSTVFFEKEFSSLSASVFNLILVATNCVFVYAVEIRMYSWAMLFCFLCCVCSYYIIKNGSLASFLPYVVFAECGAYCQYWTAVALAINFVLIGILYFAKYKKARNVVIAASIGIVLYLPWASVVIKQVSAVTESYWIEPITIKTFAEYALTVVPFSGVAKVIGMFALIVLFVKSVKQCRNKDADLFFPLVCLFTPVLLILCATFISLITRPIYVSRYAVPTVVFVIFYGVVSLHSVGFERRRALPIFIFGIYLFSLNAINNFKTEKRYSESQNNFTEAMEKHLSENTVFVFSKFFEHHVTLPCCIAYTYPKNKIYGVAISELWTDAYFYDRANLIDDIETETSLCLVLPVDEIPPTEFAGCERHELRFGSYPTYAFYFLRRNRPVQTVR